jgi:hypothetical protein
MEGAVWPPWRKNSMITAVDQPISIWPIFVDFVQLFASSRVCVASNSN